MEEHEITYVCGTYRKPGRDPGRGRIVVQDARSVSADADMKGVFMCLAKAHDLAGRKVNLVLGRDLSLIHISLCARRVQIDEKENRHDKSGI